MSQTASGGASLPAGLARNSVGTTHIVFFVVAAAAPLASVVGVSPAAFAFGNGAGVPGVYLLAGLMYLIFAVGFTAMSRSAGSAGGFYTYIAKGLGRPAGVAAASIALLTYKMIQLAVYTLLCGARNISFSGRLLGLCMLAEIAILFALSVGILMGGGGPEGITLTSFAPATVFSPGLGAALVFVVGSFMGFEATVVFSEEARHPERTIPRATFAAVALIAGFYAFSTWSITQFYGPANAQAAAQAGLESYFFTAAAEVLGPWSVTAIEILLIVSLFASALAFHNTVNRYFFALGREGVLPRFLGNVHDRHGSPHVAGRAQSVIAAVLLIAAVVSGLDPYAAIFSWTSAIAVIGILSVQILVCSAIIAWFGRNQRGHGAWTRLIAPALSILGLGTGLVLVILNLPLLAGDSPVIWTFPWLVLVFGLIGAGYAVYLRSRRPALYDALGAAVTEV